MLRRPAFIPTTVCVRRSAGPQTRVAVGLRSRSRWRLTTAGRDPVPTPPLIKDEMELKTWWGHGMQLAHRKFATPRIRSICAA